jgi:hypothetical protein
MNRPYWLVERGQPGIEDVAPGGRRNRNSWIYLSREYS